MKSDAVPMRSSIRSIVPPLLLFSASFILCMHWFLLMADTLSSGITTDVIPAEIRSTIIAYYTVVFGDMTWLIKIVILLLLVTMTDQLLIRAPLIVQGVFRLISMVDELILNKQSPEVQSQVLRTVHDAHVHSAYSAAVMIVLQIIVVVLLQRRSGQADL